MAIVLNGCNPTKSLEGSGNYELLEPETFAKLLEVKGDSVQVVDIRTPLEYKRNHIEGAININIISQNFKRKVSELNHSKIIFVYCQTAHRSGYAAKIMVDKGFEVYELKGGYSAWKEQPGFQ